MLKDTRWKNITLGLGNEIHFDVTVLCFKPSSEYVEKNTEQFLQFFEFCSNGHIDRQLIAARKTEYVCGNSAQLLIEFSLLTHACLKNPATQLFAWLKIFASAKFHFNELSLFFFCFFSSRIIGLFLLHSCLRAPWPQESHIRLPSYSKFLIIVVTSPTLAPQISCKPFLPEVPHFSKYPISTAVAGRWPYAVNLYASSPFRYWSHWMPGLCWIKLTTCEASFWVGCTTIQESSLCKSHGSATQLTMNL